MPHPSKRKGDHFERELVKAFREAGLQAERAWGSDGRTLVTDAGEACTSDVDILVEGTLRIQAKRRKALASWAKPPAGAHVTVIREDRGEAMMVMPLRLAVRMLTRIYSHTPSQHETDQ